jgi:NDP-sugar pyrophosphorylase family protein
MDVTAAILAGGLGTRLRSVVADCPKVLASVRGRPFLTYLLDRLAMAAIREVVLLTGYGAEQVRDVLGETYGPMRLVYSVEPAPLGTAGALRQALPYYGSPTVLLLNGDSYSDVDLGAFRRFHAGGVSLVLAQVPDVSRYGQVCVGRDGRIVRFEEKGGADGPGWINAGIYLLDRSLIEEIPQRPGSLERELLPAWVLDRRVRVFCRDSRFLDIGTPESYAVAEDFFRPTCTPGTSANPHKVTCVDRLTSVR